MPRAYPVVHSKFVNLTVSVLEMHPELRDGTEAIALSQDLHVEVGAPFLERTRDKLEERARAIMERRPELEHYFDDFTPAKAVSGHNPREAQLEAALRANAGASRPGRGTYRSLCCAQSPTDTQSSTSSLPCSTGRPNARRSRLRRVG